MPSAVYVSHYPSGEVRSRIAPIHRARPSRSGEEPESLASEPSIPECEGGATPPPLLDNSFDFTTATSTVTLKPGYGGIPRPTKYGLFAKRKIARLGGVIDRLFKKVNEGLFITGTIPGSTVAAFNAIACYSAYIVKLLRAWISKHVKEQVDFYVWERQKRGALHIHYYVYVPDPDERGYIIQGFKAEWIRILRRVNYETGVDVFDRGDGTSHIDNAEEVVQAYVQEVEKGVAQYLAKYCSKDAGKHNIAEELYPPTRWWGCSRLLTKKLDEMTTKIVLEYANPGLAARTYEDLKAELEPYCSIKYSYGDKVGFGVNDVWYFTQYEDSKSVMSQIRRKFVPVYASADNATKKSVCELASCATICTMDNKFGKYMQANLSKTSYKAMQKLSQGGTISGYEIYAFATECYALTVQYSNSFGIRTRMQSNIIGVCDKVAQTFENLVLAEQQWGDY